jgi:hypothetical protein
MADQMENERTRAAQLALKKGQTRSPMRSRNQPLTESVGRGLAVLMDDMGVSEEELSEYMSQQGGKPDIKAAAEQLMRKKVAERYPDYSQERIDSLFSDLDPRAGQAFRDAESMTGQIGREAKQDSGMADAPKMIDGKDISRNEPSLSPPRKRAQTEAARAEREEAADDDQGMKTEQSAVPSSYKDRLNQMFQVYK